MIHEAAPTKYLEFKVIEFLGTATAKFLESNDVSVTKFLETALANFLLDNSAVSHMLEENDISVTKFLDDSSPSSESNAKPQHHAKFLGSALYNIL